MPCWQPLKAFRSVQLHERTGKPMLTFNPLKALNSTHPMLLSCNGCIGCRLDRSEQWAVRCVHEAQMHEWNSFVTLTYADEHLPDNYSVSVREYQLFMKRLRKLIYPTKVRFFACGEYGDKTLRPHYHALIFNYGFPDRKPLYKNKQGLQVYDSQLLKEAWPYGLSELGHVEYKSARYVAGYVMKKQGGDKAAAHYLRTHPRTGLTVQVEPEFQLQSNQPGLGSGWFDKFKSDAFPSDFLIIEGKQTAIPRYYFNKLREDERALLEQNRARKRHKDIETFRRKQHEKTPERLKIREAVQAARITRLKREL